MIKIVIAPDSFKGSISSHDAAEAVSEGLRDVLGDELESVVIPIADGGEGTLEALTDESERIAMEVTGPDAEPVTASYGICGDTAVIEMAKASGLTLSPRHRAAEATTYGTGELMADAIDRGIRKIMLTAGGSATNDGGCGMLAALGAVFVNGRGFEFIPTGGTLADIASFDMSCMIDGFFETTFTVAADIRNPLLGSEGATAVYGPQKGATAEELALMERGMAHWAEMLEKASGKAVASVPGSGAAGGIAAPLIAFSNAEIKRGIDTVLETAGFDAALEGADAVVTGEGRLDSQSLYGKAVSGVAKAAAAAGVPVDVICGCAGDDPERLKSMGLREIITLVSLAPDAASAISDAGKWIREAARQYALKQLLPKAREMTLTDEKLDLFRKQKDTLDIFLRNGAITEAQYGKSLGDLKRLMNIPLDM
ncbi:MAG: glycerate kinase [Clostridia bacterium]|nr:glycerate kinase [Clostridia bacterium]